MKNPIYSRSGQGGPEFTVVVGFVMLIFLVLLMMAFQKQSESYDLQVFLDAKKVVSIVVSNIDMISQNGNGYYRYFSVPSQLYGYTDYGLEISENFLWINYSGMTYSAPLITNNVTIVDLVKGENETNCIQNINGKITLNRTCQLQ